MKRVNFRSRIILFVLTLIISFSYIQINKESDSGMKSDILTVATGMHAGLFNPLYARSSADIFVCDICNELLLNYDRKGEIILKGKSGEVRNYNGTDYTYYGIADCTIIKNDNYADYAFELCENVYFGDGTNLTADDVIFTMYVMSDPSYTGVEEFYSLPIYGMEEYRTGISSGEKDKFSELVSKIYKSGRENYSSANAVCDRKTFDVYWDCFDRAWLECLLLISDYCAENYPQLLEQFGRSHIALAMYGWGFCEVTEDSILKGITTGKTWYLAEGEMPDEDDFLAESLAFYSGDADSFYRRALINLSAETVLEKAEKLFIETIDGAGTDSTDYSSISGITKNGKYSFTIRMSDSTVLNLYKLSFNVLPLHYYGDRELFDYDNNKFGFVRGNLDKVKSLNSKPMGAGPYMFRDHSDGTVTLVRNEKYYKGIPKTKNIVLCEITSNDDVIEVLKGNIDIATIGYDAADINKILESNSNGLLSGDTIYSIETSVQSYGYIGINSKRVKVGDDPSSYESKALRKAFATMFAVYRDIAVSSFFYSDAGCRADVTESFVPLSSWACPDPTDEGYVVAFSVDKNGNKIYTSDMTESEKYTAALDTAIEYFVEAGYIFDERIGKFVDSPIGASLSYDIIIPGGGTKAHPGYTIATMASDALKTVGIELNVHDLADTGSLWSKLQNSEIDMWAAARSRGADPHLYQIYHSSAIPGNGGTDYNYGFISDEYLDYLIEAASCSDDNRYRKKVYQECFDIISDWGVEVPVFSPKDTSIFSAKRIDVSSIVKDATSFWNWTKEIENIRLK